MRLGQWCCINFFLFLGITNAANSKSQQLSAAQVVTQSRKVSKTALASEDEPLRYLVVESEQVASAAAHGFGQNALVQAIEAALGKGGVARRLSDGEKTKEYKYYKNVGVAILEVDRATPDSAAEVVVESLQASSAVGSVEADSLVHPHAIAPTSNDNFGKPRKVDRSKLAQEAKRFGGALSVSSSVSGPNDDLLSLQWGHVDNDQVGAWAAANLTANMYRPIVMVIDTGIDYFHEDIAMNAFINRDELYGREYVDDDGNIYRDDIFGSSPEGNFGLDTDGHGTHIAGIIGAVTNNGLGVAGMHYGAILVPCRFITSRGGGWGEWDEWEEEEGRTANAISCIDYAMSINADVIVNPFGTSTNSTAHYDSLVSASMAGITIINSAGMSGDASSSYPCAYEVDGSICTGAVSYDDEYASFSNWSPTSVAVAAPGVDVVSTFKDQEYYFLSGTSMAAGFVAGAAAFLKSVNKQLTNIQIVDILQRSAVPFPDWETKVKHGKLNMAAAVELAMTPEFETYAIRAVNTTTTAYTTTTPHTYTQHMTTESAAVLPSYVVLGASYNTCAEECGQYGSVCVEDETTRLNTDLQYCFDALSSDPPAGMPGAFTKGAETQSWSYPYGCVVMEDYEVHRNLVDYGIEHTGCRSAVDSFLAPYVPSWRACSCA